MKITLKESQLRQIVTESMRKVIKENYNMDDPSVRETVYDVENHLENIVDNLDSCMSEINISLEHLRRFLGEDLSNILQSIVDKCNETKPFFDEALNKITYIRDEYHNRE